MILKIIAQLLLQGFQSKQRLQQAVKAQEHSFKAEPGLGPCYSSKSWSTLLKLSNSPVRRSS